MAQIRNHTFTFSAMQKVSEMPIQLVLLQIYLHWALDLQSFLVIMFHLSMSCTLMFILFPYSTSLDMLE